MIKVGGPTLIITALSLAFAACGGGESAPTATPNPSQTQTAAETLAFSIGGSIYTVRPNGTGLRPILAGDEQYAAPALSPDGQRLTYIADRKRVVVTSASDVASVLSEIDLFVDRTPPTPIASNWSMGPVAVHWSPDGTMLLVTRQRLGGSGASDVLLMNASGTGLRIVLESGAFIEATWWRGAQGEPARILVVAADAGLTATLYDLDGGPVGRGLPVTASRPAVASHQRPGAEAVLVTSTLGSPKPFGPIEIEDADGSRVVAEGCAAAWSPDGTQIAFYNGTGIVIMNPDAPTDDTRFIVTDADFGAGGHGENRCQGLGILWAAGAVVPPLAQVAPPGATPRTVNGHRPPPVAAPTSTPDLRNAVSAEEAEQLLLQVPGVGGVLRALAASDVDALFGLIDWQPWPCSSPHGGTDLCPDGIAASTELPMVNAGDSVPFYVTADRLRPMLSQLLAGEPPALRFASRASEADDGLGDAYYLGLEGGPKGRTSGPIAGNDNILTGVFLKVRTGAERPIAELSFLVADWSAVDHANETGLTTYEVLTFNP